VSREEWLVQRKALLAKEKELTRHRDDVSELRRSLPWVRVEKDYVFEGENGPESFGELFRGRSQLIVYHFMYGPDWDEGCPSCSFWADNFNGIDIHLLHRDISLVAVSRTQIENIMEYKKRMGWTFTWVSSLNSDFNIDYDVSFPEDLMGDRSRMYNFHEIEDQGEELPGVSVFNRDDDGTIYHSYSTYSRGLDILNGAYHFIDLVPKGRDEDGLPWSMAWLRRRDQYEIHRS
jgi:predicted dithiol-disulfide oxidoreductase (DUF899 family)